MSRGKRSKRKGTYGLATLRKWCGRKAQKQLIRYGRVICIDPSCGSASSQPGYAIFEAGVLADYGIIEIPGVQRDLPYRLRDLADVLRTQFGWFDVGVVEHIPPRRYGGGGATGHASLLAAWGVALACIPAKQVVQVRPQTWHATGKWDGWSKDDANDAIALGVAVFHAAELPTPKGLPRLVK